MQQREIQLCGCSSSEQQTCLLGLEEFRNLPFVVASKHPRFLTELQVVDSRVGGLSAFHQCASKARCHLQYSMGPKMTSLVLEKSAAVVTQTNLSLHTARGRHKVASHIKLPEGMVSLHHRLLMCILKLVLNLPNLTIIHLFYRF